MGHAYYEFQHVELANVGSGKKRRPYAGLSDLLANDPSVLTEPRPHSRVKNPPGGPTSNIFAAEEATPTRPSARPNKMASSIPFGDTVDSPPSSASSSPPPTPVKSAEVLPQHHEDTQDPAPASDPNLAKLLVPITRKVSPNPVTGQGYEPAEPVKKQPSPQPTTPRRRVPPGGYSSPLW